MKNAICLLCLVLLAGCSTSMIHISAAGDDANPGTADQPVASLHAAQVLVRQRLSEGQKTPINVLIHPGTYELDRPLVLDPRDSGTAACPVTWRAADPANPPVLSGGRRITGRWIKGEAGVWHVDLEGIGLGEGAWNFRQLFVDGKRATRARFPNADQDNPFLYATGGDMDHALIEPALIKQAWGRAPDAQLNMVPNWKFFNQWNTVTGVDARTGRIDFADSERHARVFPGNWFYIEGVREELDQAGEWYLDPTVGRLYYMPEQGVDPNTLTFTAPCLNRIIYAHGDVNQGTHVEHVHFDGLEFRHTTFTLGHIEARVHTDAVILFENTLHSSVRNCRFENIGGYAFWLHLDSRYNSFDRNAVYDSGGGGVLLTGARLSYMDDSKVYTPGEAAAQVAPILNRITRNTVEHCGRIRYYGGGVHLDSRPYSMSMSPGNYIAHNYFNDLSRNGIFAFRNQGGNVVEYNHIHNAMQTTIDGACIHFATMNHLNAPNYILNNWLYDIWGYNQKPDGKPNRVLANGVFLDWDTSNTTVRDNYVHNAGGQPIKVIWENVNVTNEGNVVTDSPPPFVDELGPEGTASNGIDIESTALIGSILHYTDREHVKISEGWTPTTAGGQGKLFEFYYLVGSPDTPAEAVFNLPIPEDGTYQVWLLYTPHPNRASNAGLTIAHAEGKAEVQWNMRKGSKHGFAVLVGAYPFTAKSGGSVKFTTQGADGYVIVDAVGFVKFSELKNK